MIRLFTRAYEASAAILPFRIVAFSDPANGSKIATAASATALPLVGTTGKVAGGIGDMVDVDRLGLSQVQLGGTVAAGDRLTSDAQGRAIKATVAGQFIVGRADQPGVLGDVIDLFASPDVF
jgi:hypothetical protein